MPTKVLVFESDTAFAGELRTELGRFGLVVEVVDDGNAGLSAAQAEKPDLILLSIELPRMNGFSVCNKLKKDPGLRDVPLVIMSSESSDETFDQHRKLRTRAEDYVHKPIAFGELLEHIRPYIPAVQEAELADDGLMDAGADGGDDSGIVIEDAEIDPKSNGVSDIPQAATEPNEEDVDTFAESAFGRLMVEKGPSVPPPSGRAPASPPPEVAQSLPPPPPPEAPAPIATEETNALRAQVEHQTEETNALRAQVEHQRTELVRLEGEGASLRAQLERSEETARQAEQAISDVQRLQHELDEIRVKAAAGAKVGAVSGREYLDLREALNRKDKEILALRDQVMRKERELLESSEANLALERSKADYEDRIGVLETQLGEARSATESARSDHDLAAKRADDYKNRSERLKTDLDERTTELGEARQKSAEELASRDAEIRALNASLEETQASKDAEIATLRSDRARLEEQWDAEKRGRQEDNAHLAGERDQARRDGAAEKERLEQQAQVRERDHAEELDQLRGEHERLLEQMRTEHAGTLEQVRAEHAGIVEELRSEHAGVLQKMRVEHSEVLEKVRTDLEAHARSTQEQMEQEHRDRVADLDGQLTEMATQLASRTHDLSDTRTKLDDAMRRLDRAQSLWLENHGALENAKDALAAALAHIEDVEGRGIT